MPSLDVIVAFAYLNANTVREREREGEKQYSQYPEQNFTGELHNA